MPATTVRIPEEKINDKSGKEMRRKLDKEDRHLNRDKINTKSKKSKD